MKTPFLLTIAAFLASCAHAWSWIVQHKDVRLWLSVINYFEKKRNYLHYFVTFDQTKTGALNDTFSMLVKICRNNGRFNSCPSFGFNRVITVCKCGTYRCALVIHPLGTSIIWRCVSGGIMPILWWECGWWLPTVDACHGADN